MSTKVLASGESVGICEQLLLGNWDHYDYGNWITVAGIGDLST